METNNITSDSLAYLMAAAAEKMVVSEEEDREMAKKEKKEAEELKHKRKLCAGFTEEFINDTKFKMCQIVEGIVRFRDKIIGNWNVRIGKLAESKFILFTGKSGRGKSHLLYTLATYHFNKGHNMYIIDEERDFAEKTHYEIQQFLKKMYKVKYLFIDDLGFILMKEETRSLVKGLIAYRIKQRMPTYITTNVSISTLMGVNMGSRVEGYFGIVEMNGTIDKRNPNKELK